MEEIDLKKLGPLANLVGIWEGDKGVDVAPSKDRSTKQNLYRERVEFVAMDDVHNHEQHLVALRYKTTIWPVGSKDPFHEELGYWLWDADRKEVLRCFLVPRGISIIAGGSAEADSQGFTLEANSGDCTHGICANKFLDEEFKTVRYVCKVKCDGETFSYEQTSTLKLKGREELFDHTDKNTLRKI
jgi:hypothetical protein